MIRVSVPPLRLPLAVLFSDILPVPACLFHLDSMPAILTFLMRLQHSIPLGVYSFLMTVRDIHALLYCFRYLTDFRIKQSCYLLEHSNLSITAIANSIGFDNSLYFSKTFHKEKGMSPKKYRGAVALASGRKMSKIMTYFRKTASFFVYGKDEEYSCRTRDSFILNSITLFSALHHSSHTNVLYYRLCNLCT